MWLEESDPDDVDFNVIEDNGEGDTECDRSKKTKKKRKRKTKGKGKKKVEKDDGADKLETVEKEDSEEDEEDLMERFEFEVEEDVAMFVDEFSIGRREIPQSSDEDEDPMVVRSRRIRRGRGDKLVVGHSFLTGIEFKEAVLDYSLRTGYNIKRERSEKKRLAFKCGIGGKCKWRVYCSFDESRQVYVVKTTYAYHSCTPNGYCNYLKSPVISRYWMDDSELNSCFVTL